MSKAKPINLGRWHFASKSALEERLREIFERTADEAPLTGDDADLAAKLFKLHPEYEIRIRENPIHHFTVSTAKHGTRCFYIVYDDGKMENFSWEKIVKHL